jgi:hypothetical protein
LVRQPLKFTFTSRAQLHFGDTSRFSPWYDG